MKRGIGWLVFVLLCFTSCLKHRDEVMLNPQLYPLTPGNKWIYVDSFFNDLGQYEGNDTFTLKTAATINFNGNNFTPITDQFDDSIFILRSDESEVFMLMASGESLFFTWPLEQAPPVIWHAYNGDVLNSAIYTEKVANQNYPAYKIVITQNPGAWYNYRQQEYFFTPQLGIIKGRNMRKKSNDELYTTDAYILISYFVR